MSILKVPSRFIIRNNKMRLALYALFGIVVADGLLTNFLVTYGYSSEVNPFLKAWVGRDIFLIMKIAGAFLATLLLWIMYNSKPRLIYVMTIIFLVFYIGIVSWNLFTFITA